MTGFRKFLLICGAIAVGLYVAYLAIFPSITLRYRLTVDVDVDGVTHTGSGVVEFTYQPMPDAFENLGGGAHFAGDMRGYAITVDLGERRLVFVVNYWSDWTHQRLRPESANLSQLPFAAYGRPVDGRASIMLGTARELQLEEKGPVDLPLAKLPMIGRFEDINNIKSWFEALDPLNLAAAYGPGVQLRGARLEFTSDPVTPMPSVWPQWLKVSTNHVTTGGPPHLIHPSMSAFKGT